MKLGVVTTSYPREPGDPAGSFVAAHVRWLERQGHQVEVVAAGSRGAEGGAHRVPSRLFYRGGAPEALESGGPMALAAAAGFSVRQLGAIARRLHRWDAVCAHWLAPPAVLVAAAMVARRSRAPLLAVAHSGDVHLLSRLRLAGPAARLLLSAGAQITFTSGKLAAAMERAAGRSGAALAERALICPMGVELPPPRPAAPPRQRCRVLFLGRLVPIKGADLLVEAMATLDPRFELIIAGEGPERGALAERIQALGLASRVELVGEVRGPLKSGLLASADLLVAPSRELPGGRAEGMPVAVLEAIAAGCPVLVSRSGGLEELPDSVPKVAPGDVGALRRAVAELGDPERRRRLLQRQRPIAEAQRWERVGAKLWRHWVGASITPTRQSA